MLGSDLIAFFVHLVVCCSATVSARRHCNLRWVWRQLSTWFFDGCVCLSRVSSGKFNPFLPFLLFFFFLLVVPVFGFVAVFKKRMFAVDLAVVRLFGEFSSSSCGLSWSLDFVFAFSLDVLLENIIITTSSFVSAVFVLLSCSWWTKYLRQKNRECDNWFE